MAMTAWAAKVWRSEICLSVNGFASVRRRLIEPSATSSRSSGTLRVARKPISLAIALPSGNSCVSVCKSITWTGPRWSTARPLTVPWANATFSPMG